MVSARIGPNEIGELTLYPERSLSLWKIRSRAYYFGQRISESRIAMRDAFYSAKVRYDIPPDKEVEDSFLNYNLSVGYETYYPLKQYLKKIRAKHEKSLKENA